MVILTINGKGNRFLEAGITTPKFMLEYKESTVIHHIIENLKQGFPANTVFYIGLNKDYLVHVSYLTDLFVKNDMNYEILVLEDTKGQADTVKVLLEKIGTPNEAMWVVNCDTLVSNEWKFDYSVSDIVVEVFDSDLPVYSYIDKLEDVTAIAEKQVISKFASTGNYFFQNSREFIRLYSNTKYGKEIFISDVIQSGIKQNLKVTGNMIPSSEVTVLGTPAQYDQHF